MDDYHYDLILQNGGLFVPEDSAVLIEAFSFEDELRNLFRETELRPGDISQSVTALSHTDLSKIGPFTGGLRLLICPNRNIEQKSKRPQPANETTVNTIPLSIQTFETVLREFQVPKSFLKIYSRRTAAFHTSISSNKGDENPVQSFREANHEAPAPTGVAFRFVHQTDSNTKAFFSIGGSYCPSTGITSLLLCGLHEDAIGEFKRRLRHCLRRVPSPFLLSVVLVEMRLEYLESRIDEVHISLHRQKITLDLDSTASLPSHSAPDSMKTSLDIAEISKDVTEAISRCASKTYGCETQMKLAPKLLEAAEFCQKIVPDERKSLCRDAMIGVSSRLRQHEFWLATMHTRAQYLMHRAQGYASTIYNLLSQRDNALSRQMAVMSNSISSDSKAIAYAAARDSTAMKVIALVTTLFLPATFTATLFSTSFFDFQATEMGSIVSHRVWIYFVIAFSLTLLILGAGYPFYMMSLRRVLSEVKERQREAGEKYVDEGLKD